MKRRELLRAAGGALVALGGPRGGFAEMSERSQEEPSPGTACEVAAYYFPQYHPDPRNDAWHGKGWTEWDLVKAATPRFPGHRQPLVPAWGYFDESDPDWAAREIDLAADHGITCFLYDWYWYGSGTFLADGLEKGFLRAPNRGRLKFALMWANHHWLNIHPARATNRPETLETGHVPPETFERLTDHVVRTYLTQPNYLTLGGEPFFSLYEPGTFIDGIGGMDAARRALDGFRRKVRAAGFPGLHLNAIVWGNSVLPSEGKLSDPAAVLFELGFSSVGSYVWVHHHDPNADGFPKGSYAKAAERNFAVWEEQRSRFPVPYYPNVTMGWDPSPRTVQSDRYEARGYPFTAVLDGNTPERFRDALTRARAFALKETRTRPMVTLNAWNEWTEGSYLLPDTHHGSAYLEAIRDVFGKPR